VKTDPLFICLFMGLWMYALVEISLSLSLSPSLSHTHLHSQGTGGVAGVACVQHFDPAVESGGGEHRA
jgi:hypothetical protein